MTAADPDGWQDFCARLGDVGAALLAEGFPEASEDRADGFRHLAEQVVCWLAWAIGHADPRYPCFQRQNDLVTRWGGPNADNVYRHARIDPAYRYRIRGRMHSCDDFILALRAGFMHMERWGTLKEATASELGIHPDEEFELLLGGDDAGAVAIPDGVVMASIREYYFDWQPREPATFTIECLDPARPPGRTTLDAVGSELEEAISAVEHSMGYWNTYMREARAGQDDNQFGPPVDVGKGLEAARYAFCFYQLQPGEALYVESDVPDARYWSFQLYRLAWFEPYDIANRITTINHTQTAISSDGMIRVVLADTDPGTPNWLDSEGRPEGLLMLRWFWPSGDPSPRATVVELAELREHLPPGTPVVSPGERADVISRRRHHLAWRFRT